MAKIAKIIPNAKELKKGSHITNYSDSMAYASDFAGTNPFGGICINRTLVDDYEGFREQITNELSNVTYKGAPVFKWLKPREALYCGEHINRYPDILFEMIPELGSGMSMHTDIFTPNPTHKKISGGHKKNGVFFIHHPSGCTILSRECRITNLYKSLISLYELTDKNPSSTNFIDLHN